MKRNIIGFIALLLWLGTVATFITNQQRISDWWTLRSYEPSDEIRQLADDSFFNEHGRKLFYVTDPEVNDAPLFNENCPFRERSLVLGCYTMDRIFIFNVTDERLDGVQEVTAAHEMLHAAYARLGDGEKKDIIRMLDDALMTVKNQRVLDLVASYREVDESTIHNEMHSIFGTELRDLPPELEAHYEMYFNDRSNIVAIAERYEAVFTELQEQAEGLFAEIEALKVRIADLETLINEKKAAIDQVESELDRLFVDIEQARSDDNANLESQLVDQYNSIIVQLDTIIADHNAQVAAYNQTVKETNQKVETYNATVSEQGQLIDSINSKKEEIESS